MSSAWLGQGLLRVTVLVMGWVAFGGCDGSSGPAGPGGNGGGGDGGGDGEHTWYGDIGPLLIEECGMCHQEGGIGPFPITYDEVKAWGASVVSATEARTMPPMPVNNDGSCRTFSNARWLTEAEIASIKAWVDDGAPLGEEKELPGLAEGTSLDAPYFEVDTGGDYEADDSLSDDYRCFPVDLSEVAGQYLTAYEVIPGNREIAHHMILYMAQAGFEDDVLAKDAADAGPGYGCGGADGGRGAGYAQPIIVWAPSTGRADYPAGTGIEIPPGRVFLMEMHYNLANGPGTDRTTIRMRLEESVDAPAVLFPLGNLGIQVQPGQEYVEALPEDGLLGANGRLELPDNPADIPLTIHGVFPHMHSMGRSLGVTFTSDDGGEQCLVDVPRWDFNWQDAWWYDEPFVMPEDTGRTFEITCGYDTRSANETVVWGENTKDEMCLNYVYLTSPWLDFLTGG